MKPMSVLILAALATTASATVLAQTPPPAPPPAAGASTADTQKQLDAARQRLEADAREVAQLSSRLGEDVGQRYMRRGMMLPRAVLGVQIDSKAGVGGASVVAVSPGGAAAGAGIEAGDVITAIDGVDLSTASEPSRALMERMRALQPDAKVKLKVAHGGKAREVEVTARAPAPGMFAWGGPPGPGGVGGPGGPGGPHGREGRGPQGRHGWMAAHHHHHLGGLKLATLSPRLGGYFGAKGGVLVEQAGTAFKLEDGDVITSIDGREVTSARQARRILGSYGHGEKATIKVLRDRKAVQVDVVLGAK
jgi:S1-C subfamily serine protease